MAPNSSEDRAQRRDNPELYARNVQIIVVKMVPGSKRARVEMLNQIKCFFINFLKVVIAVDVLMETSNEFLQQKISSSRSLQIIKFFDMRRSERFLLDK